MAFNRRKMKKVPGASPGTSSYIYKNLSIIYSLAKTSGGEPAKAVSIASHGIPCIPPTETDISGILAFFEFDSSRPVEHFTVQHPGVFGMGDSIYYLQAIA